MSISLLPHDSLRPLRVHLSRAARMEEMEEAPPGNDHWPRNQRPE